MQVPFMKCPFTDDERIVVDSVMHTRNISTGDEVLSFEEGFEDFIGCRHAITCCSGTAALDLAVKALVQTKRLRHQDVVIIPSFTFAAVAACLVRNGITPRFVDINPNNFTMEVTEEDITEDVTGIMAVHTFGVPCNMSQISRLARENGLTVIEDCAEACGATCEGYAVGNHGDIGIFSFNATKNLTTGEGGMVVTNDNSLAREVRLLREHGIPPGSDGIRRDVVVPGFNYRMSNILAAIGRIQLRRLPDMNKKRQEITEYYNEQLGECNAYPPSTHNTYAHWVYSLVLNGPRVHDRDSIVNHLRREGIEAKVYFDPPLHRTYFYRDWCDERLCNTDLVSNTILQIPMYPTISREEADYVVEIVREEI